MVAIIFSADKWTAGEWGTWASVLAQAVLATAIIITIRQIRADHSRSRRERSIDLMQFWTSTIVPHAQKVYAVRDVVESLESRQCEALWKAEELRLDTKHKIHLLLALGLNETDLKLSSGNDYVVISCEKTLRLRETLAFYMNCLEVVFCAWRHNIADSEFLAEEFGPLLAPLGGGYPMELMRNATGIYPSIAAYITHAKKLADARPMSKPLAM